MDISIKSNKVVIVQSCDADDNLYIYSGEPKSIKYNDTNKFIKDIPMLFKNVKGVLLNIFRYNPKNEFKSNLHFCEAIKAKMDEHNIRHYFDSVKNFTHSLLFSNSKISIKTRNKVLVVVGVIETVQLLEYEYTENGYKETTIINLSINIQEDSKIAKEKILCSRNPKKIILVGNPDGKELTKFLRIALKSDKLIAFDYPPSCNSQSFINEWTKWFMDKTYTKYFVMPSNARTYILGSKIDGKNYSLITLNSLQILPFSTDITLRKLKEDLFKIKVVE
uniref:Uncharacterized protein n=1 Tax=Panagrolaimus davidi TaxID=227884 RepID=A0A914QKQ6_9BILA